jgi:hypothetical protein
MSHIARVFVNSLMKSWRLDPKFKEVMSYGKDYPTMGMEDIYSSN